MSKRILMISSSPRRHGNSDRICDEFMQGALDAGNQVEKVFLADYLIHYCLGCGSCSRKQDGKCVQSDDMALILEKMVQADIIVFATPVYFYNMAAQMKTLIDRTCPRYNELGNKAYYIIMSAAEEDRAIMDTVLQSFQGFFNCLENVQLKQVIYGLGIWEMDDVEHTPVLKEAYQIGNHIEKETV